jgi:tetratricopeptide (TPR) repeat protein
MRASGEMRVGGAVRAGVVVFALLAALALAGCPGKKEKAAPPPEVTPTVNEIFEQGVDAMRRNEIDKAVMSFSLITQKAHPGAPEIPHAYFYLGLIAYRAGNMELAVQNFNAALKLDPSMDQARLSLGNAQFAAGKVDEAIASWEELAKERPNLSSVHNNLGVAYLDRNNLDKALEHLEQTVALSPDNYRAQKNLADAYRRKGMTAEADAADRKAKAIRNRLLSARPPAPETAEGAAPAPAGSTDKPTADKPTAGPTAGMEATPEPAAPTATP